MKILYDSRSPWARIPESSFGGLFGTQPMEKTVAGTSKPARQWVIGRNRYAALYLSLPCADNLVAGRRMWRQLHGMLSLHGSACGTC